MREGRQITAGSPGWMVTYADMMSLLLCLFVLLLSFSKIDSTSFKKNAGPINNAFGVAKTTPELPAPSPNFITLKAIPVPAETQQVEENRVLDMLDKVLADELDRKKLDVEVRDNYVIVRFPGSDAFPSGEAELVQDFLPTLDKIREVAARTHGRVVISGHTDDVPIATDRFRSNWDLSAARAASVAHYLLSQTGIAEKRILVQGAADSQPLVPNDTPEHRARNRRVEIALEIAVPKPAEAADAPHQPNAIQIGPMPENPVQQAPAPPGTLPPNSATIPGR